MDLEIGSIHVSLEIHRVVKSSTPGEEIDCDVIENQAMPLEKIEHAQAMFNYLEKCGKLWHYHHRTGQVN